MGLESFQQYAPASHSSDFHTYSKLAECKQAFICIAEQLLGKKKKKEKQLVQVTEAASQSTLRKQFKQ